MSTQPPPASEQDQPSKGDDAPKRTGRLRSSCDNCHRSKIKCTGTNPCSACQGFQSTCTYSRGGRLGRPKGSRNKKTSLPENNTDRVEAQPDPTKLNADVIQWPTVDLTSFDPGIDHGFGSVFADNFVDSSLLFKSNDLQALFTQNTTMFDPPRSLEYDSASGTDNVTTPPNYSNTLTEPGKTTFGNTKTHSPVAPTSSGAIDCSCLQQLIKLIYQLEDLRYSHATGPAIDAVLEGVKLAEAPWKVLMQCSHCHNKDTYKEASLLFSMSIRILLASIQKLSTGHLPSEFTSTIAVSIGSFSLPDDTKQEVIDTVIRKALQAIAVALVHLWERTGKPRLTMTADQEMIDVNDAPLTPISLFANTSDETQKSLACYDLASALSETKNTVPLLSTLECLMKVTEEELKTSTY
nr:transcription factor [Phaeosphaeriaceae sp. CF-150626]